MDFILMTTDSESGLTTLTMPTELAVAVMTLLEIIDEKANEGASTEEIMSQTI